MAAQPFTGRPGTGPFFGRKPLLPGKTKAENMDLSPYRPKGTVPREPNGYMAANTGTVSRERLRLPFAAEYVHVFRPKENDGGAGINPQHENSDGPNDTVGSVATRSKPDG